MDKAELFKQAKVLVDLMEGYRKTAVLQFRDVEQKLTLQEVYKEIFPGVRLEIACSSCVLNYMNILVSWYGREFPLYQASLPKEVDVDNKIHFVGVEQKPEKASTKKPQKEYKK